MTLKKRSPAQGIYLADGGFHAFGEAADRKAISGSAIATRRSAAGAGFGMGMDMAVLPNPDPVLRKAGKSLQVYRDLRTDSHVGGCVRRRKAAVRAMKSGLDRNQAKSRVANGDLVNLYRVVTHHLEEFVRQFKWAISSRQVFKWLQETRPETLTDVQRAARFFYLQQESFGGRVSGQTWGTATTAPSINLLRIEENLSAAHLRLAGGTYIEQLDWAACVDRYDRPHTLFYLDPPYWQTEGYGVPFPWEQYELMATKLKTIKGKAVISINDHPAIRECFAGYDMEALKIDYTVGGGANRVERGELVIYNWDRQAEPAGLF